MGRSNCPVLEKNFTSDKFPPRELQIAASAEVIVSAKLPGIDTGNDDDNEESATSGYAAAGLQFAVALVLFALGGNWLDHKLGTAPWLLLLGVFGGGAAAFYSMYRKVMAPYRNKPDKK